MFVMLGVLKGGDWGWAAPGVLGAIGTGMVLGVLAWVRVLGTARRVTAVEAFGIRAAEAPRSLVAAGQCPHGRADGSGAGGGDARPIPGARDVRRPYPHATVATTPVG